MKKTRLMFLLSLFLTSIPLVAQTEDEAKLAAVKFLQQKKGVTLSNLSTVKVVTGKSAGWAFDLGLKLISLLEGDEKAEKVRASIYYKD